MRICAVRPHATCPPRQRRPSLLPGCLVMAGWVMAVGFAISPATAEMSPVVTNVRVAQGDGTDNVLIQYNVDHADTDALSVSLLVSDDGGETFNIGAFSVSGDIHGNVRPGADRQIVWDAGRDVPRRSGNDWVVEIIARDNTVVDLLPGGIPLEFVVLPPGEFTMGSTTGFSSELPPHPVRITRPFCLGIYELTQAQWRSVMGNDAPWIGQDMALDGPHHPGAYLSRDHLEEFLHRLNGTTAPDPGTPDIPDRPPSPVPVHVQDLPGMEALEFVWIPPGSFTMGSPEAETGHTADEAPRHQVTLTDGYFMGRFPVTQAQWQVLMDTAPWEGRTFVTSDPDRPATYIQWEDAREYVRRLNEAAGSSAYRLPTEAEWEYACRAGSQTAWNCASMPCDLDACGTVPCDLSAWAWYRENTWDMEARSPQPVGVKLPNAWGLYDMHGNVWEWCQDWYGPYDAADATNPTGPATGIYRVLRGGSFADVAERTRCASRMAGTPHPSGHTIGFRIVRDGSVDALPVARAARPATGGDPVQVQYRLPTEAEWEYACRAGTNTRWSFGDDPEDLRDYAWYRANTTDLGRHYGHRVGTRRPNPWGLYDMHGNLWEWVQDYFGAYPGNTLRIDPTGPASGAFHSRRGGGFANADPLQLRAAMRGGSPPYNCGWCLGTRLARDCTDEAIEPEGAPGTREGRARSASFTLVTEGTTAVRDETGTPPASVELLPNRPNPFNRKTDIRFILPQTETVTLAITDVLGRPVRVLTTSERSQGRHTVTWDGRDAHGREAATGVYLVVLQAGEVRQAQRLLLLR